MPAPPPTWMRIGELSRRVDVTPDTLRVWERRYGLLKPRRTTGNLRMYSALDEARVRVMKRYLSQQIPPAQAAELALSARLTLQAGSKPELLAPEAKRAAAQMRDALDAFDESSAEQAIQQLLGEYSALAVIRDVLMPYLHEVGERWAANHMNVAQEHFASNFLHSRLVILARGWDRGPGPRALLAAAPGEHHTLGLIAFGIALHTHRWSVTYLGAATPVETLESAAARVSPDLIAVAASVGGRLAGHVDQLRAVGERWPLVIAGAGTGPRLASRCHAGHLADDPITAAAAVAATTRA